MKGEESVEDYTLIYLVIGFVLILYVVVSWIVFSSNAEVQNELRKLNKKKSE